MLLLDSHLYRSFKVLTWGKRFHEVLFNYLQRGMTQLIPFHRLDDIAIATRLGRKKSVKLLISLAVDT